jgi:hypothetical protein
VGGIPRTRLRVARYKQSRNLSQTGEAGRGGFDGHDPQVSPKRARRPSQSWRTFLQNHAGAIVAMDFFVVPTVTCRLLYVLVVMNHARRKFVHFNITDAPTSGWTAQQILNAFPDDTAPK